MAEYYLTGEVTNYFLVLIVYKYEIGESRESPRLKVNRSFILPIRDFINNNSASSSANIASNSVLPTLTDNVGNVITPEEFDNDLMESETEAGVWATTRDYLETLSNNLTICPFVLTSTHTTLYRLNLPFKDQTRLDKIVPLQVQDFLPYDTDELLVDSVVLGKPTTTTSQNAAQNAGQRDTNDVIAALTPSTEVANALQFFHYLNIDPEICTIRSSLLRLLPIACQELSSRSSLSSLLSGRPKREALTNGDHTSLDGVNGERNYCIVSVDHWRLSLVMQRHDGFINFRETSSQGLKEEEVAGEVLFFLREEHQDHDLKDITIILTKNSHDAPVRPLVTALTKLGLKVQVLDLVDVLSVHLDNSKRYDLQPNNPNQNNPNQNSTQPGNLREEIAELAVFKEVSYDYSWSLASLGFELFALDKEKPRLINFRKGPFLFRRIWKRLATSIQDELFYFSLALITGTIWLGSVLYSQSSRLQTIDDAMRNNIRSVLNEAAYSPQREKAFVEEKLADLEKQLASLGSIASLSPLQILKELSETISSSVDLEIESLVISAQKVTARGSASDFKAVGQLSSLLENNKKSFCEVKVDSGGRDNTSSRAKFSAEILLCE